MTWNKVPGTAAFSGWDWKGKRRSPICYLWPAGSRAGVLHWGLYWAPRNVWRCLEIVWVVAIAGRAWGRPGTRCRTKNCSQIANFDTSKLRAPDWRVTQTFWNSGTCSGEVLTVILRLLLRWKRMPTDQSPVFQLPPGWLWEMGLHAPQGRMRCPWLKAGDGGSTGDLVPKRKQ